MTKSHFFQTVARERADNLSLDAFIERTANLYRRGEIAQFAAIDRMRAAGACEPEILAAVG